MYYIYTCHCTNIENKKKETLQRLKFDFKRDFTKEYSWIPGMLYLSKLNYLCRDNNV